MSTSSALRDAPFRSHYGAVESVAVATRRPRPWSVWLTAFLTAVLVVFGVVVVHVFPHAVVVVIEKEPAAPGPFNAFFEAAAAMRDDAIDPCEDFYQHACGQWLKTTTIPADANGVDTSFSVVAAANEKLIDAIVASNPPVIGPMYSSCLGAGAADASAMAALSNHLEQIAGVTSKSALFELAGAIFAATGASSFFDIDVQGDPKNATRTVLEVAQGGLSFPSLDYYTDEHKRVKYTPLFVDYVSNLGVVETFARHNMSSFAHRIFALESAFAAVSASNTDLRDPWSTYHAVPIATLAAKYPHVAAYLSGAGVFNRLKAARAPVLVPTPEFFEAQSRILTDDVDLPTLQRYVSFRLVDAQSPLLGDSFRNAHHAFHGALSGAGQLQSREAFCLGLTTTFLGPFLGQYYLERVWDPATKAAAQELITEIESAMAGVLRGEAWLDGPTKAAGLAKLHHIFNLVGGPDATPPLPFALNGSDFFGNVERLQRHALSTTLATVGEAVDPRAWGLFASTVNAYYDPSANKMVFPAAILQAPFYSAHAMPPQANYARIGMVMGHELTHGFDDQGRNYDAVGNLRQWWSPTVAKTFDGKADCLAEQYSRFEVVTLDRAERIGFVNGRLTLGENIADNGGLKLAYLAWEASKKGEPISDADRRLYFLSFAQAWCEKRTDAYAELLLTLDPHSPGKWRVNGPLMNSRLFAETFQCPIGSPMNPADKCVVW
ncbi:endothelin-converting enzyme 1, metalloprotease family M13 [Achlya hypogyna]|uniref:Endothelin-converting enzyme 1, metalloprotease family M13 n=1 Tax=Achlya hypogyna TaxID=1202772 RepID=A0A1V9Z1T6_ACHHY|nr:endothelin-converting enzyme 1, metalloprotease family M13 [Achlya hypogyna]